MSLREDEILERVLPEDYLKLSNGVVVRSLVELVEALEGIENWCKAYPKTVFVEPRKEQWAEIRDVLKNEGYLRDY